MISGGNREIKKNITQATCVSTANVSAIGARISISQVALV